jgi:cytochrome c
MAIRASAILCNALACLLATPAWAADPMAGKVLFAQQCVSCHTAEPDDNGGLQGPSLTGVLGRRAAADPTFYYTRELRDSKLVWNAATLDRFLAAPDRVVHGTTMTLAVAKKSDREDLIAYLRSVTPSATTVANVKRTQDALLRAGYGQARVHSVGNERSIAMRLQPQELRDVNEVSVAVTEAMRKVDPRIELHRAEVVRLQAVQGPDRSDLEILLTFVLRGGARR